MQRTTGDRRSRPPVPPLPSAIDPTAGLQLDSPFSGSVRHPNKKIALTTNARIWVAILAWSCSSFLGSDESVIRPQFVGYRTFDNRRSQNERTEKGQGREIVK